MQSKLGHYAARLSESAWLAAVVVTPILFNIYTERVFEEDKIPLLRSIALLLLVALVVWAVEQGRESLRISGEPVWKAPLVLPTLILTGSYLVSTLLSVMPRISFWGAYVRRQGTYTWLAYIVIFFAVLLLLRDRRQAGRLVTAVLLASVPATLYAFLQNRGLDPLPWGGDVVSRVSSTAGNPIFIAAYLIMVYPLTLMRVIEHFRRLVGVEEDEGAPTNYLASSLLAGAYLFLLIIQTITIVFSQSRGPWIGLGVGLAFFAILFALQHSRVLTLLTTAVAMLGIAFLVTLNIPNGPLEPLRQNQYIGRLGRVFEVERGTGRVRTTIWEGAVALLEDDPVRDLIGYGPETMYLVYPEFYPPLLQRIENRNASPDRAHNETFDSLIMNGVVGFVAQTVLFLLLFYYILNWLGMVVTSRQKRFFVALLTAAAALGVIVPYLLEGSFRFAGVGLPAAISVALVLYLLGYALTHLDRVGTEHHPDSLLLVALLAGVVGHYIEVHFGIAIGVTRLYFWLYAALAVVVGARLLDREPEAESAPAERRRGRRGRTPAVAAPAQGGLVTGTLLITSLLMGLIMSVMMFNYFTPQIDISTNGFALVWLFIGTWLFGALAVAAEAGYEQGESGRWRQRLSIYALFSIGPWLAFTLVYVPWVRWQPSPTSTITPEQLVAFAAHIANNVSFVYVMTFLVIALGGWLLLRGQSLPRALVREPKVHAFLYPLMLLAILPIIVVTNLNVSRADVFTKQGTAYERGQQWDAARILYDTALDLQPDEDRYFLNLGRALLEQGRRVQDDSAARTELLREAQNVLERAQDTNPLNTDHARNLASLHRVWAAFSTDPAERERHLELSDSYYEQALALSPANAGLWNDWAALDAERNLYDEALEKLDRSAELDSRFLNTMILRGNVALEAEQWERALESYEAALEINAESVAAQSGRAFALARLERTDEAIEANLEALRISPGDFNTHKNLALLYQDNGNLDQALVHAREALALAGQQDQPAMEAFVQQLTQQLNAESGG